MSYRIALGFEAAWADFCVPRDGDIEAAGQQAMSYDLVRVVALDEQWRDRFAAEIRDFSDVGMFDLERIRLAERSDLVDG